VPYGPNEIPTAVKNQSKGVIALFRKVFNDAYADCQAHNRGDCDNKARQAAWSAVKAKYYKAPDGKWKPKKRAYDLKDSFAPDDPDLPINVAVTLSADGISIWVTAYNEAKAQSFSNEEARDLAWDAIREKFVYNPSENEWEVKHMDDKIKRAFTHNSTLAKSEPKWSTVDKSKLPKEAFAVVGDPEKRSTWKYPHHFVKNGVMYLHSGGLKAGIAEASGARWHGGKEKASKDSDAKMALVHMRKHAKDIGMGDFKKKAINSLGEAFLDALADVNILVARREYPIPLKDIGSGSGVVSFVIPAAFTLERAIGSDKEPKPEKIVLIGEGVNTKPDRYRARMTESFMASMKKQSKGRPVFAWHKHTIEDSLGYVEKVSGDSSSIIIRSAIESPQDNPQVGLILRKQQFGIGIYYSVMARILDAQLVEEGKAKDYYIEYRDGEPIEYSITMMPGAMVSPVESLARTLDLSGLEHADILGGVHIGFTRCGMCSCGGENRKKLDKNILRACDAALNRMSEENVERTMATIEELRKLPSGDRGKIGDFVLRGLTDIVARSVAVSSLAIRECIDEDQN
jgi:cation transport regulator ChaB